MVNYIEYQIKDSLSNTISYLRVCTICGVLVVDRLKHDEFHATLHSFQKADEK